MTTPDFQTPDQRAESGDDYEDVVIADGDVISAARSCFAIVVIFSIIAVVAIIFVIVALIY